MKNALDLISERGVISGILIGAVLAISVFAINKRIMMDVGFVWFGLGCAVIGFVFSLCAYELSLPVLGLLFGWISVYSFNTTVSSDTHKGTVDGYKELRRVRKAHLSGSSSNRFAERIRRHIGFRKNMSFLLTSSLFSFFALHYLNAFFDMDPKLFGLTLYFVMFLIISTLVGEIYRSYTLGRAIGDAHIESGGATIEDMDS